MSCERFWEILGAAGLTALPAEALAQLEDHAEGCADCAQALATERLLSQSLLPQGGLRPSRRLQEALLAVPRQAERGGRLRALGIYALPVSVFTLGLLAFLAPEFLRRQRALVEQPQPLAGGVTERADATMAATLAPTPSATLLEAAERTERSGEAAEAGAARSGRPPLPAPALSPRTAPPLPAPAATATFAAADLVSAAEGPRRRPHASATPAPPEAGSSASDEPLPGQPTPAEPRPGPLEPKPIPPEPVDPTETVSALVPGPQETATPEGPPGGGRGPEPSTPEPTPEASRRGTTEPGTATPTPGSGDPALPITPPSEPPSPTPSPTATPSPSPTPTP